MSEQPTDPARLEREHNKIENVRGLIESGIPAYTNLASALESRGAYLIECGQWQPAVGDLLEALEIRRTDAKDDPQHCLVHFSHSALRSAMVLFTVGQIDRAAALADETIEVVRTLKKGGYFEPGFMTQVLRTKAKICVAMTEESNARAAIAEALDVIWPAFNADPAFRSLAEVVLNEYAEVWGVVVENEVRAKRRQLKATAESAPNME